MKKLAIIAACLLTSALSYGQGTLDFDTYTPGALVTVDSLGGAPAPSQYVAQLYGGLSADSLAPIGSPVNFLGDTPELGAGYIMAGTITLENQPGGVAYMVQMHAWNPADMNEQGMSEVITIASLGGAGDPPATPAGLAGLQGFVIPAVPEPSTIALGLLGGASLLLFRRRK